MSMALNAPEIKRGTVTEAQRFARKRARHGGWNPLLFGKLGLPPVEETDFGSLCVEDDRALVERARTEGRL